MTGQLAFTDVLAPPFPRTVGPMLPSAGDAPFDSADHVYELKWDGVRALAFVEGTALRLQSRGLRDITAWWPELRDLPDDVRADGVLLDGEIVAPDEHGRSRLDLLHLPLRCDGGPGREAVALLWPAHYQAFDLLYLDGLPVTGLPWEERRRLLERVLRPSARAGLTEYVRSSGTALFEAARRYGVEGVVAKNRRGPYVPGRRSSYWTAFRALRSGRFVIGGYTFGGRNRPFETILLGLYDGGRLTYAGQAAGPSSDEVAGDLLRRLEALHVRHAPFARPPDTPLRFVHWCRPELVCRAAFGERADDGTLRFARFQGLRPDVPPRDCTIRAALGAA